MITVRADWRMGEAQRLVALLRSPKLNRALSVAVNQSAKQVRTMASGKVAKAMGARRKDIDRAVTVRPFSTPATLEAIVRGRGIPLPLSFFKPRQTKAGVSANAWGETKIYPGTFMATMKSGHRGVFVRKGRKRLPIKELWGPGVAQVMAKDAVTSALESYAVARLEANIMRQLDRYTRSRA